ncbi:hypothetical protein OHC33_002759 [Knufia fluminis]|uniref:Uncharacterized protein n=1 Tax=Knufia fluminis TaxID=191047 RepID=A0AAN8EKZ0_9EURO|nr:hypothetical protein OHC33_002759 [Knufia fluminis]
MARRKEPPEDKLQTITDPLVHLADAMPWTLPDSIQNLKAIEKLIEEGEELVDKPISTWVANMYPVVTNVERAYRECCLQYIRFSRGNTRRMGESVFQLYEDLTNAIRPDIEIKNRLQGIFHSWPNHHEPRASREYLAIRPETSVVRRRYQHIADALDNFCLVLMRLCERTLRIFVCYKGEVSRTIEGIEHMSRFGSPQP